MTHTRFMALPPWRINMVKSILHPARKGKLNFYELKKFIYPHFRGIRASAPEGHIHSFLAVNPAYMG